MSVSGSQWLPDKGREGGEVAFHPALSEVRPPKVREPGLRPGVEPGSGESTKREAACTARLPGATPPLSPQEEVAMIKRNEIYSFYHKHGWWTIL